MTIQEKINMIRAFTDQKKRKEAARAIIESAELNEEREAVDNKASISVADYGDYIFISQQMILRKEGE